MIIKECHHCGFVGFYPQHLSSACKQCYAPVSARRNSPVLLWGILFTALLLGGLIETAIEYLF